MGLRGWLLGPGITWGCQVDEVEPWLEVAAREAIRLESRSCSCSWRCWRISSTIDRSPEATSEAAATGEQVLSVSEGGDSGGGGGCELLVVGGG